MLLRRSCLKSKGAGKGIPRQNNGARAKVNRKEKNQTK